MSEETRTACWACGDGNAKVFFELPNTPVNVGVLWRSAEAAMNCPRGDIRLAYCPDCGLIFNQAFDAGRLDYNNEYDNSLHHSPLHRQYAQQLAERLIQRHGVRNKTVVEIGAGKGDFLKLVCELGDSRGFGFDPSLGRGEAEEQSTDQVKFVADYYGPQHADVKPDLICCRHVFEHIDQPRPFLETLRGMLDPAVPAMLYFEVPNARNVLRDFSVWTIIYEHCTYFAAEPLQRLFSSTGFRVLDVYEGYNGQFLSIEAIPGAESDSGNQPDVGELAASIAAFAKRFEAVRRFWKERLGAYERNGARVVAWGAGARTVGLFNTMQIGQQIPYVVDLNPNKHDTHLAGTGQRIVAPEFLRDFRPEVVVVINEIYTEEIRAGLDRLGVQAELQFASLVGGSADHSTLVEERME